MKLWSALALRSYMRCGWTSDPVFVAHLDLSISLSSVKSIPSPLFPLPRSSVGGLSSLGRPRCRNWLLRVSRVFDFFCFPPLFAFQSPFWPFLCAQTAPTCSSCEPYLPYSVLDLLSVSPVKLLSETFECLFYFQAFWNTQARWCDSHGCTSMTQVFKQSDISADPLPRLSVIHS